ncbi:hypothetical protein LR48_Vigan08g036900 [Vigna angularis]|uniref:Uncharacterized protein n=1 Tax=Phaseolus angularis TaxID=3914 RepID=A0A0L9V3Q5_PHAAN|nr:uncharacterized protein HKW66_Vig0230140 [Vigna angularis]KOM49541.1 hypothetical protein LR48_Vigan08g036800 [Vigna angularis]KOM49542.1 hypothetical protein LR48_Vigan08g036900 [Vigna angularis]
MRDWTNDHHQQLHDEGVEGGNDWRHKGGGDARVHEKAKPGGSGGEEEREEVGWSGQETVKIEVEGITPEVAFLTIHPIKCSPGKDITEALSVELISMPKRRPTLPGADENKHCLYHKNMDRTTEECVTLKDKIEELIRA